MSAKEMFELYGYNEFVNDLFFLSYIYVFNDISFCFSIINFNLKTQTIEFYYSDDILNCIPLKILQAINKQIEELQWN